MNLQEHLYLQAYPLPISWTFLLQLWSYGYGERFMFLWQQKKVHQILINKTRLKKFGVSHRGGSRAVRERYYRLTLQAVLPLPPRYYRREKTELP